MWETEQTLLPPVIKRLRRYTAEKASRAPSSVALVPLFLLSSITFRLIDTLPAKVFRLAYYPKRFVSWRGLFTTLPALLYWFLCLGRLVRALEPLIRQNCYAAIPFTPV